VENMEKNRLIIENMNKQYGDTKSKGIQKIDKSDGFGAYRVNR
jgi:ribosomal protein S24E